MSAPVVAGSRAGRAGRPGRAGRLASGT